jgi:Domain of unknown function (DUF1707)
MAQPPDQTPAAAGHGDLRASHADREQVIGVLKAAFVQGRLTKDELDARVGQAFAGRTYGQLAAVTIDLPPGLATGPQPSQPARARTRPPVSKVIAGAALVIPPPAMVAAAVITGSDVPGQSDVLGNVAAVTVLVFFMAWIAAGLQLMVHWHDNRARRRQLPPRPAPGGHAAEGGLEGQPGHDLMLCQAHRGTRARRPLGHSVTQRIWRTVPTRRASAGLCT